jgi:hypothetical protein
MRCQVGTTLDQFAAVRQVGYARKHDKSARLSFFLGISAVPPRMIYRLLSSLCPIAGSSVFQDCEHLEELPLWALFARIVGSVR